MAQQARSSKLESRSSRLKLTRGERHRVRIVEGCILIYRRELAGTGAGTWSAKLLHAERCRCMDCAETGKANPPHGIYRLHKVGPADDFAEADGAAVLISTDKPWRVVKAFKNVSARREDHFTEAQVLALIDAAREQDPCFADLCEAAFHTGARAPGELAQLDVQHFDTRRARIVIPDGKTGGRITGLTQEGVAFFGRLIEGKRPRDILLPRAAGARWGKSGQHRPMTGDALVFTKADGAPGGKTITCAGSLRACKQAALALRSARSLHAAMWGP